MREIMKKRLRKSEKERHWVIVPARCLSDFPPPEVPFTIEVNDKSFQTYIDIYRRLRLGSRIFNELDLDAPDVEVIVYRKYDEEFLIEKVK